MLANIFQPLIDVFDAVIRFFHDSVGLGWGLSIIALTVVVRLILVPLTLKQFRSMQAMQRLSPQIKEIQQKYKDDKQRQQQELMAFYKDNQVNPFGSCLPLLLQMPVFLSLFYMLRRDLKEDICGKALHAYIKAHPQAHVSAADQFASTGCDKAKPGSGEFLFIPDITHKAAGLTLVVLIVLYVGSQLGSSLLMSASVDRNQRLLMMGLPILFVTFIINFPAGLIVYWITTNLWTVGQSYVVRRIHPPVAPAGAGAGAPAPKASKASAAPSGGAVAKPPPSPRRKKKRSGRRR